MENPEGRGGGATVFLKKGKSGQAGGSLVNFPPWWGYGYFLEPHISCSVVEMPDIRSASRFIIFSVFCLAGISLFIFLIA